MRKQTSLEVCRSNAGAASLIEDGNYREAIHCLSASIMEFSYGDDHGCECCQGTCSFETTKAASLDQFMLYTQESFKEDGKPYLYKNPIRIPLNRMQNYYCKQCCDDLLSTAMVFNLALCHHLQALEILTSCSEEVDDHLQKAIILYQMAFDIQQKKQFVGPNYILVLAIMNNISMIYRIRNNETLANEGFQRMLSILMYLVESGKNKQCGNGLEGFHYNVSSTVSKSAKENVAGAA